MSVHDRLDMLVRMWGTLLPGPDRPALHPFPVRAGQPDLRARPVCVYAGGVGRVNIYLSDELQRRVRDAGLPVSEVCQRALRAELAVRQCGHEHQTIPGQMELGEISEVVK